MYSSCFLFLVLALCASAVERISLSVKEEEESGSLVGILLPKLPNRLRSLKDQMSFQIIQKGDAQYFRIAPQDGRIILAQKIDREAVCNNVREDNRFLASSVEQCKLRFTVSVLREGTSEIIEMLQVTVSILDVNDNKCRFEPSDRQTVYIPEDASVDSSQRIPIYIPHDPDSAIMNRIDPLSIMLKSADDIGSVRYFDLQVSETNSPEKPVSLHLMLTRKLDYEVLSVHKLLVTASDASRSSASTCSLQITVQVQDVNDHPPRFVKKSVHLNLNENTPIGSLVHQLQASDHDKGSIYSKLIYSFGSHTPEDVSAYFDVIPLNGSVILKQRLSYSKKRKFEIPVVVRNPVESEIIKGTSEENYELKISNYIQVETTEHDTSQIVIDVIDVNDESPIISSYTPDGQNELSVEENASHLPSDFAIVSVTDGDSGDNGRVECALTQNVTSLFRLIKMASPDGSADEGRETLFKLSAIKSFDREHQDSLVLTIVCHDFGSPQRNSSKNLIVLINDVNDNSPLFSEDYIEFNVTEDSDPARLASDYIIGRVLAHDPDEGVNAELTYDLIQPTPRSLFSIDPKTGVLSSTGELDREVNDCHRFAVIARDSGTPQLSTSIAVTVHVHDYNDEPPVFTIPDFEFMTVEGVGMNTFIGALRVSDADLGVNRELKFRLFANDLPAHYPIASSDSLQHYNWRNEQTSVLPYRIESRYNPRKNEYEISVLTDGELDAESATQQMEFSDNGSRTGAFHSFFVVAEDGGIPKRISRAHVIVHLLDINDNSPVILFPLENNASVNVSCYEYVGYPFTQVLATDADAGINGTVQYFLSSSQTPSDASDHGLFQIERSSGGVSLKRPLQTSDVGRAFILYIIVSDMGPQPLHTQVKLQVLVDRSPPKGASSRKSDRLTGLSKSISDSMINLFIIIFIVAAAFIILGVLLTAVCITLNRSRRHSGNSHSMPMKAGGTSKPCDGVAHDLSNNAYVMPELGALGGSYTLSRADGKVYQAIPLVSTDCWLPAASSGGPQVYATMNPMLGVAGMESLGIPASSPFGSEDAYSRTLPFVPTSSGSNETRQCTSPPLTYTPHSVVKRNLNGEVTFWMGSQDALFESSLRLDRPGSNDQDSGHGDSLEIAGTGPLAKAAVQAKTQSPFAPKSYHEPTSYDGTFMVPICTTSPRTAESEETAVWRDGTSMKQKASSKTPSVTSESCSTFI